MHEIITLQLGQQSNYLATHFWNAQESYFTYTEDQESLVNHDIHWRPGIGADGTETYMPRTVIYDLKGGFGCMRKTNALYADPEDGPPQALWNGPTALHQQPPIAPSAYQQALDAGLEPAPLTTSTVRYWSDFNRVFFHPRSIVQLNEYELNSSLMPFERWASGEDLFNSLDKEHDVIDRDLRAFVEEADQMQGIQIMAGLDDAWGGFASVYAERLRDEYGKTPLWVWGLQDSFRGVTRDKRLIRLTNRARTMTELYKQASIIVPLTMPRSLPRSVSLDPSSEWHTSALFAAAIESVTLPMRLRDASNRVTMAQMEDMLNTTGKQSVAGLQMSFAQQPDEDSSSDSRHRPAAATAASGRAGNRFVDSEDSSEGLHLDLDFSTSEQLESSGRMNGFGHKKPRVFSQVVTLRGYENEDGEDVEMSGQDEREPRRNASEPVTTSYSSKLRFPLLDSFPQIFKGEDGEPLKEGVNITSSLFTDSSVSDKLKTLRATVARSIGLEDREGLSNDLAEMADEYHEGWSSGSDEGDDE